jgi:hypothetical protein
MRYKESLLQEGSSHQGRKGKSCCSSRQEVKIALVKHAGVFCLHVIQISDKYFLL